MVQAVRESGSWPASECDRLLSRTTAAMRCAQGIGESFAVWAAIAAKLLFGV